MTALTTADRQEISDLFARYAWAFDLMDYEAFVACFTEDAIYEMADTGPRYTGHAGVRSYLDHRKLEPEFPLRRQHFVGQTLVEGSDRECTARSYGFITSRNPDEIVMRSIGYYVDRLVKGPSGWRFASRIFYRWSDENVKALEGKAARP